MVTVVVVVAVAVVEVVEVEDGMCRIQGQLATNAIQDSLGQVRLIKQMSKAILKGNVTTEGDSMSFKIEEFKRSFKIYGLLLARSQ